MKFLNLFRRKQRQDRETFVCASCGMTHEGPTRSWGFEWPDAYEDVPQDERSRRTVLGSDQCIVDEKYFLIRGCLELAIRDIGDTFAWGVWVLISQNDYDSLSETWETQGREKLLKPIAGRLNNVIPRYKFTGDLPVEVVSRPVGVRPLIRVTDQRHELFHEQRDGITLSRVREFAHTFSTLQKSSATQ